MDKSVSILPIALVSLQVAIPIAYFYQQDVTFICTGPSKDKYVAFYLTNYKVLRAALRADSLGWIGMGFSADGKAFEFMYQVIYRYHAELWIWGK